MCGEDVWRGEGKVYGLRIIIWLLLHQARLWSLLTAAPSLLPRRGH